MSNRRTCPRLENAVKASTKARSEVSRLYNPLRSASPLQREEALYIYMYISLKIPNRHRRHRRHRLKLHSGAII